jgi:hypothetical protein
VAGGKASPASSVWAVGAVCVHILHGKSLIKVIKTANIFLLRYYCTFKLQYFLFEHLLNSAVYFV